MSKLMNLGELTELMRKAQSPIGFIVSSAVMQGLRKQTADSAPSLAGVSPSGHFGGIAMVEDPALPDTEIEVAYTEDAWRKRINEIKQRL